MIGVIGSGPSAVAAAHVLWQAGLNVTLLDAGFTLESGSQRCVETYLADRDPDRFVTSLERAGRSPSPARREFNDKLYFGSDFPYRDTEKYVVAEVDGADIRTSLALGGLSNVWGSAVLPAAERDIDDWPISRDGLADGYRALDAIMDVARESDGLDAWFGEMPGQPPDFPLGRQGADLLARLAPHRTALAGRGIRFGRARLAVGRGNSLLATGCQSCGLCMYGCPFGTIFNAAHVVERLRGDERFDYKGNLLVEAISEDSGQATVQARDLRDGTPYAQRFDRVFVAAGPVSSTAIVARSLGWQDVALRFRDSQHFVFPILRFARAVGAASEEVNRLAQVFFDIDSPEICDRLVHIQLYGYNHLVLAQLKSRFGRSVDLFPGLFRQLIERLFIVQGFLHSDVSGTVHVELPPWRGDAVPMPRLRGEMNPRSPDIIRRTLKLLRGEWRRLGGVPLARQLFISPPGLGRHIGGSMPMRAAPSRGETDLLGRPQGFRRVHVVDASVLPSIPATTITYTVMANAARIAADVARDLEGTTA